MFILIVNILFWFMLVIWNIFTLSGLVLWICMLLFNQNIFFIFILKMKLIFTQPSCPMLLLSILWLINLIMLLWFLYYRFFLYMWHICFSLFFIWMWFIMVLKFLEFFSLIFKLFILFIDFWFIRLVFIVLPFFKTHNIIFTHFINVI